MKAAALLSPGSKRPALLPLLRDRTFGPFMAGKLLSTCGIWVQNIAAAVLMFELTGSAFLVGAVSAFQFAGPLVLALWAGALSDRLDRRRLLMTGRMVSATAVGFLAVVLASRGVEGFGGPVVLLAAVLVMGFGLALTSPAMQSLVPSLVEPDKLEQALALNSIAPSLARTVGPAAGAGLLVLGGPALAFAVAAGSHTVFVAVLLCIRGRPHKPPGGRPRILGGVRYLVDDRNAGMIMLSVALLAFGADPVVTLTPSLADQLGGGGETVGMFATAFGLGSVALVAVFSQIRRFAGLRATGVAGILVQSAGLAATAFSPTVLAAATGFFVTGAGFMMATISLNTRIQRRVPEELRGRVMALWGVAFLGSRPFAAMANGSIADTFSIQAALLTAAVVVAAAAYFGGVRYGAANPPAP